MILENQSTILISRQMKYLPLLFFTVIVLISCSKPKTPEKESAAKIEEDSIKLVAEKLAVQNGFPPTFTTTYEYQKYLSNNNKVLISKSSLLDLVEKDSVLILSIQITYFPELFADIICKENQIIDILDQIGSSWYPSQIMDNYSLIVEITSIEKVKYGIETSIEDDSYDTGDDNTSISNPTVRLELDAGNSFICKGVLINLIPDKK